MSSQKTLSPATRNKAPSAAQLVLQLEPKDEVSFACFFWGEQGYVKTHLQSIGTASQKEHFFYLWGEAGCGKSHLLQACCHHIPAPHSAVYLPLKLYKELGPNLLEGIEHQSLIAIDDIDVVAGDAAWEEALFHLINRVRLADDKTLMFASRHPPHLSKVHLPDLKSRLHFGLAFGLMPLKDNDKMQALYAYAKRRGIVLSSQVLSFLVNHYDRNMHHLIHLVKLLDTASLAEKRKITIPFIKQLLSTTPV